MSIYSSTSQKAPAKKRIPEFTWLRDFIHRDFWGRKCPDGVRHCNTCERVLSAINARQQGHGAVLDSLTNARLQQHCDGKETFYFTGGSKRYQLGMIDIDCHASGTYAGAVKFAKYLRDKLFPDLYYERSTNGNGVHCYFIFDKWSTNDPHRALKELDAKLKNHLAYQGFNVELVEIKGLAPIYKWDDRKRLKDISHCGLLAKIPRGLLSRFDDLKATTSICSQWIRSIETFELPTITKIVAEKKKSTGSGRTQVIKQRFIDSLPSYRRLAESCMADLTSDGELRITIEDKAVALLILRNNFEKPADNFSFSQNYAAAIWGSLYASGVTDRAWNHHRWRAIRNYLADHGWLDCKNETYTYGQGQGRSCQFILAAGAAAFLDTCSRKECENDADSADREKRVAFTWEGKSINTLPHLEGISFRPKIVYQMCKYRLADDLLRRQEAEVMLMFAA
jgi:hypothetical protein